jgi:GNAT superfamily N-acetyltransferase
MTGMSYPFVDHTLAARLEAAEGATSCGFVDARARIAPDAGAGWHEVDGARAIYDGPGSPLTQSFGLGMAAPVVDATLDGLERFFRERGAACEHEVSPLALGEALTVLSRRGYEPFELTSVMFQPTSGAVLDAALGPGLTVRVVSAVDAVAWAEVAADGWSDTPEVVPFVRAIGEVYAHMAMAQCFLVEHQGVAAAAGVLAVHDGVALLAGASTRPAHRRKGAQLALLGARLAEARQLGCDLAMMAARPGSASQRNAERHGFRIAYTRIKWRKRGA